MILKFFKARNFKAFSRQPHLFSNAVTSEQEDDERLSSPLRIVRPGGVVDSYYMAVPAGCIIEKYPSFLLTRPEVFRRPWDSMIRPDEMLTLGQRYFLVPRRTVKKLRQRSPRPSGNEEMSVNSSLSICSDVSSERRSHHQTESSNFSAVKSSAFRATCIKKVSEDMNQKNPAGKKHVRFAGVEMKDKICSSKIQKEKTMERKVKTLVTWQPSLTVIRENQYN